MTIHSSGLTLVCLAVALAGHAGQTNAQGYWPAADTDNWSCRLCPEQSQNSGNVTAGVGHVSNSSEKFGDYTGLDKSGAYPIADADIRFRGDRGRFVDGQVKNLGIDSRRLSLSGGQRGRYQLAFDYHRIPHFVAQDTQTVFSGVGSDTLTLPTDWETAASTRNMPQLEDSLRDLPLGQKRDNYRIGAKLHSDRLWGPGTWDWGLDLQRTEQTGHKLQGANFLNSASVLPVTLNRVTEQMDARVSYTQGNWHLQAAYHSSVFTNNQPATTWDNPFTPLAEGGNQGRIAQEPGNRFDQLMLSGRWQPTPMLQTSGQFALGRAEQNDAFLPPTINPFVEAISPPANNLNGQVDTLNSQLRLVLRPASSLSLTGEAYYQDRDNRTPREEYWPVRSDLALAPARFNRPYSFTRQGGKLRADYRAHKNISLASGASREVMERSFQEVEKTSTTKYWGELRAAPVSPLDLRLRVGRELRRFMDDYRPLADLTPGENPLLRRYHLGERDRDLARATATYTPVDRVSLGLSLDYASDDYRDTQIGLTDARDLSQSLDISATPWDRLTLYGFYSHQRIDANQAGSESFAGADWSARQQDSIDTLGFGWEVTDLGPGLDLGLDYGYSLGRGQIRVHTRDSGPDFPDLKTRLNSVQLFGRYRLTEQFSVRLDYWYERLSTDDFHIDNIAPHTIPTLLSAGQVSPHYSVHVVGLSLSYSFN